MINCPECGCPIDNAEKSRDSDGGGIIVTVKDDLTNPLRRNILIPLTEEDIQKIVKSEKLLNE